MEADVVVFLLVRKCRRPYFFLGMYLPSLYSNELMAFDISISVFTYVLDKWQGNIIWVKISVPVCHFLVKGMV